MDKQVTVYLFFRLHPESEKGEHIPFPEEMELGFSLIYEEEKLEKYKEIIKDYQEDDWEVGFVPITISEDYIRKWLSGDSDPEDLIEIDTDKIRDEGLFYSPEAIKEKKKDFEVTKEIAKIS